MQTYMIQDRQAPPPGHGMGPGPQAPPGHGMGPQGRTLRPASAEHETIAYVTPDDHRGGRRRRNHCFHNS